MEALAFIYFYDRSPAADEQRAHQTPPSGRAPFVVLLVALLALALLATAALSSEWDYRGAALRPATLADCDKSYNLAISFNSGTGERWERFCYRSIPPRSQR